MYKNTMPDKVSNAEETVVENIKTMQSIDNTDDISKYKRFTFNVSDSNIFRLLHDNDFDKKIDYDVDEIHLYISRDNIPIAKFYISKETLNIECVLFGTDEYLIEIYHGINNSFEIYKIGNSGFYHIYDVKESDFVNNIANIFIEEDNAHITLISNEKEATYTNSSKSYLDFMKNEKIN